MRKIGLVFAIFVGACGGASSDLVNGGDDGGATNDGGTGDASTSDASVSDGGTKDASTKDAGTIDVKSVPGLVIWLEGDLSSSLTLTAPDAGGTSVTLWADQTTHHNDAKGAAFALARNPTVRASAIHGHSAVHFNKTGANATTGNMLTIPENSDSSLDWGTGDFYVAIVGDFDNDPTDGGTSDGVGNFFSKATLGGTVTGTTFYGNVPGNGSPTPGLVFFTSATLSNLVTTSTPYNNSAPHVFGIRRQSGKLDLFVDGVSLASTTPASPDDQTNVNSIRIGADGDANQVRLDGDIGEIIAVKDVLSASDQSGIEAYLKSKWGTP
jgi:hypothetical protein